MKHHSVNNDNFVTTDTLQMTKSTHEELTRTKAPLDENNLSAEFHNS